MQILDNRVAWHGADGPLRFVGLAAAELAWPTRCIGCDEPHTLLCERCRMQLPWICQRWACPTCGAPFGHLTCTECEGAWETRSLVCAMGFSGLPARLVTIYKDSYERRLAPVIAAAMATALDEARSWAAIDGRSRFDAQALDGISFVPATPKAFARRGFDHMEQVAHGLSTLIDIPVRDVLVREEGTDQRLLGRLERRLNVEGTVEVVADVRGMRLLLLDDVVTTGASMRSCAGALLAAGAREVSACALARVW